MAWSLSAPPCPPRRHGATRRYSNERKKNAPCQLWCKPRPLRPLPPRPPPAPSRLIHGAGDVRTSRCNNGPSALPAASRGAPRAHAADPSLGLGRQDASARDDHHTRDTHPAFSKVRVVQAVSTELFRLGQVLFDRHAPHAQVALEAAPRDREPKACDTTQKL
jgi:hypothetical protein